jgi:UDP-N-acetylglucosamine/UDP-N-acetylgalactosamine diphosphorylase
VLCDTLKKASNNFNVKIPWYIMTSRENNADTIDFFEKNNYFNYGKENIKFFIQTELPMVDEEGKILLEEKWKIKKASDGHGGIFKSMYEKGIIEDMKNKGVKWIFINGVDNILANMVDDLLLGIAIDKKVLVASKSIAKNCPEEKVGVFCKRNGKPSVVEYTEITKEMSEEKDENGELKFGESHILSNLFNIEALIKMRENKFQYHVAHKKANYIKNGELIKPTEPNAYKFESFLFDAFELLDDIVIMRVKREDEFAPIKNAQGVDSPETAKKLYLKKHLSDDKVENKL